MENIEEREYEPEELCVMWILDEWIKHLIKLNDEKMLSNARSLLMYLENYGSLFKLKGIVMKKTLIYLITFARSDYFYNLIDISEQNYLLNKLPLLNCVLENFDENESID